MVVGCAACVAEKETRVEGAYAGATSGGRGLRLRSGVCHRATRLFIYISHTAGLKGPCWVRRTGLAGQTTNERFTGEGLKRV